MRHHDKRSTVAVLVLVWVVLWINFVARDFYAKGYLGEYYALARATAREKHALTYGTHFYDFLEFVKQNTPEDARYGLRGIKEDSLDGRRAMYYLYPRLVSSTPAYIFVYSDTGTKSNLAQEVSGFRLYRKSDQGFYIERIGRKGQM